MPGAAQVIESTTRVLGLFWGRKKWPRQKLRETIRQNHGADFGLYRAKQTRFAGKFREMQRLLRCKVDLQQVVVTAEYGLQKFASKPPPQTPPAPLLSPPQTTPLTCPAPVSPVPRALCTGRKDDDDPDSLTHDVGPKVKAIILDDLGFWTDLVNILKISMPILKLLRMMDSNKSVIGKVYDRMYLINERLKKQQVRPGYFPHTFTHTFTHIHTTSPQFRSRSACPTRIAPAGAPAPVCTLP